jgi:hypothetical protein
VDTAKVAAPSAAVLAYIHSFTVNPSLQTALVLLNIGYVLWRWCRESRRK